MSPEQRETEWCEQRLGFLLPHFCRISWAGREARDTWAPRLQAVRAMWAELTWRSVGRGDRQCALLPPGGDLRTSDMKTALLPGEPPLASTYRALRRLGAERSNPRLAVGSAGALRSLRDALDRDDHDAVGELLGYPHCCRQFFARVRVDSECVDTTWAMAAASPSPSPRQHELALTGQPEVNLLWRAIGIRPVLHLPCSTECAHTTTLAHQLTELASELGYETEAGWLREVLSWPVRWSALHGIAEITTPVLRISTRTDATGVEFVITWRGEGVAEHGAVGLGFPHRAAAKRHSRSPAFRRGLTHAASSRSDAE